MTDLPTSRSGDFVGWPKLLLRYPTSPDSLAALLPAGLEPWGEPVVQISFYCVPVHGEPEFGVSTKIPATFEGTRGYYTLGIGIDQEAAIFISRETNGQPKFPCSVKYFRLGDAVHASAVHQGTTFISFDGTVTGAAVPGNAEFEDHEWWIKVSRAVGGGSGDEKAAYDFPPHVVDVRLAGSVTHAETLDGQLSFVDSEWDPYTELLPMLGPATAELVTAKHTAREITLSGALDPEAFWSHADTIGGSRWPGTRGGPRR